MERRGNGHLTAGLVIAVLSGLLQPLLLAFAPVVIAQSVLLPWLYAWSGFWPAAIAEMVAYLSVSRLWGGTAAAIFLAATAIPAAACMLLARRPAPFFGKMRVAIGAQILTLLVSLAVAKFAVGGDLALQAGTYMRTWLSGMSAGSVDQVLLYMSAFGYVSENAALAIQNGTFDAAARLEQIGLLASRLTDMLRLNLPAMLVTSGTVTGVCASHLTQCALAARGEAEGYVPLETWFCPNGVALGLLGCYLAAIVCQLAGVPGADAVTAAVMSLLLAFFEINAVAGFAKRFKARGMAKWKRRLLLGASVLFASVVLQMAGVMRTILGSKGLVRAYVEYRTKKDQERGDRE